MDLLCLQFIEHEIYCHEIALMDMQISSCDFANANCVYITIVTCKQSAGDFRIGFPFDDTSSSCTTLEFQQAMRMNHSTTAGMMTIIVIKIDN